MNIKLIGSNYIHKNVNNTDASQTVKKLICSPLTEILLREGVNIKPAGLLNLEAIKSSDYYRHFNNKSLKLLAEYYNYNLDAAAWTPGPIFFSKDLARELARCNITFYGNLSGGSIDSTVINEGGILDNNYIISPNECSVNINMRILRDLPIRQDLIDIINSYIFKTIKYYINLNRVVYKGFYRESFAKFKNDIIEKGYSKHLTPGFLMCLSAEKDVSERFASHGEGHGGVIELDPSKLKLMPCEYNCHKSAFIFHRTELEIRTPMITKESIKNPEIFDNPIQKCSEPAGI